jgi:hypothetical protein
LSNTNTSSTNEFHSPHAGQRPIHLGDWFPQFWQKKAVFDFVAISLKKG